MTLKNSVVKIIDSVGKNNKPIYAVVAVACANAIFKPLTSLTDKKEKPETKRYAAAREFLTEVVAVPTYIACAKIAEHFAHAFKNPEKAVKAKSNLSFIGVCTAAVFVIPALCSLIIKPLTDRIFHRTGQKPDIPSKLDVTSQTPEIEIPKGASSDFKGRIERPYHNYNMQVFANKGGLTV